MSAQTANSGHQCPVRILTVAVLLKSMQQLGHLPRLQDVPFAVVAHIRSCLFRLIEPLMAIGIRGLLASDLARLKSLLETAP